ncbi:MAG: V-type ATP synthase subunit I [Deltaproteobacteria bacterium]
MFTTDPLELVNLVVLKDKAQDVSSYLLASGAFHPVDLRQVEGGIQGLSPVEVAREYERFDRLQARAQEMAAVMSVKIEAPRPAPALMPGDPGAELARIDKQLAPLVAKREELLQAVKNDEAVLSQVSAYLSLPLPREGAYSFLRISLGKIDEKNIEILEHDLAQVPHVISPFSRQGTRVSALFIGLKRDSARLDKALADAGWQEEEFPKGKAMPQEAQERLRAQIAANRGQAEKAGAQIAALGMYVRQTLSLAYSSAGLHKALLEARRQAVATEKTVIFSGWVPAEDRQKLFSGVRRVAGASYIEAREPRDTDVPKEDIPVRFARNPLLAPFGLLVGSYGVPRYGTLDPTFFVALSFVFMFGLMFGDLGQGLVFALIGAFTLFKVKDGLMRQFAALLVYCGTSGAIFGLLEGSAFGVEFHSLFREPLRNVDGLLSFSVYAGIAIISIGILLNVVNALRDRNYVRLLFDKAGLIGGLVYWSAIAVIIRTMFTHAPVPAALYAVILGGIGCLFLFPIVEFFMHRRQTARHGHEPHGSFLESFIESLLGLLEFAMGYLANTVSFVRMGAFALAHAALLLAIFQIAHGLKGAGSLGMIVVGNIVVMVLEGVVVSIQSLRLNYYEFFSKFFISGKTEFKPLSI